MEISGKGEAAFMDALCAEIRAGSVLDLLHPAPLDLPANGNVVRLAPAPTAGHVAKMTSVQVLGEALGAAQSGQVAEVFVVVVHPDGTWTHNCSTLVDAPGMVGKLAIAQSALTGRYLAQQMVPPR